MNKQARILIVDDERFHLNVIVDLLGSDYQVVVAKCGERALEIASAEPSPDLILLDVLMPDMDGYEVCRQLKKNKKTSSIPVIFLTVKRDIEDETHGFALGAVDYITKPFSPPIVKARVGTQLILSEALNKLANQNELLELKVQERTREIILAQEEKERLHLCLQQAQKMESIGLLSGGIAHDFNNILHSVIGFAELAMLELDDSATNKEISTYLDNICQAGDQGKALVAQLLAFSRGVPSKAKPMKLAGLVSDVLKLLQPILPSQITLETELDNEVPMVMADKIQIHQVVMNLCINARDAMNEGRGRLSITLKYRQNVEFECSACHTLINEDVIELAVKDDGSGMDENLLGNIFEPFFSTKEIGKGSGMGLSVVNNIMHKHQGHIVVDTGSGKGTTFKLLFRPAQQIELGHQSDNRDLEDSGKPVKSEKGHILLVDNDVSVAFFLKELLELHNYCVTICHSNLEALDTIKAQPSAFGLLITDQLMPDISEMQNISDGNINLPVILCSSAEVAETQYGVTEVLNKPLESEQLLKTVDEIIVV